MRIAIVADTYPPLRISGAVQMGDLARELVVQGHEPTVIVPGQALTVPWSLECANGIRLLRCRTAPTKDVGYVRRTINELRLPYALLRGLRQSNLGKDRWDGIVWYSPSIFLGPAIRILRKQSQCRSYLILRDIFPEWAVDLGLMRRGPVYYFFKLIERGQYSVADIVGVQTAANLAYMADWAKQPGRRLEVLQNWLSDSTRKTCRLSIAATKLAGRKIFVYVGNMGVAQGMSTFLDLARRMRNRTDAGFLFVGRGSEAPALATRAGSENLDNVIFHDEIDPSEIPGLLLQCHAGIVALDPRHRTHNIPGKFLTYIQAGLPVLARINPGNDLETLINDDRVGYVCAGGDAVTLEEFAIKLLEDTENHQLMHERAQALSRRLFSSETAAKQIVNALSAIAIT